MSRLQDVLDLLAAGKSELSSSRAKRLLQDGLKLCDQWRQDGGGEDALVLRAQLLAELAAEEDDPRKRTARWRAGLTSVNSPSSDQVNPVMVDQYASLAVDCFQDRLCQLTEVERRRILHSARVQLDRALAGSLDRRWMSSVLARKSAVLRQMARLCLTHSDKRKRVDASLRCAQLAVETSEEPGAVLELGLSEWMMANLQKTDSAYVANLRTAEACFKSPLLAEFELGPLTLARFYRLTFRPMDACETFATCVENVLHVRRIFRASHMYAEAATQLWYGGFPEEIVTLHLQDARSLVTRAIGAGYTDARTVLGAAYVGAILEGSTAGASALNDLCPRGGSMSWERAISIIGQADLTDLPSMGFALGVDQSAAISRLGTFAADFLGNLDLAGSLYRTALRQDASDVVALTNLSRILVARDDQESWKEADRLLSSAASVADRRFRWWRVVREDLDKKLGARGDQGASATPSPLKVCGKLSFVKLSQIRQRFGRAELLPAQERGYELERLVYQLAKLTFCTAGKSYRIDRGGSVKPQLDGYFECGPHSYRVECKWEARPSTSGDIALFHDKLDAAGVSGLFMSMSGFDESALERARTLSKDRAILLMDGAEIRAVMNGTMNFDDAISRKRSYFSQHTEPYHRVVAYQEVTEAA